MNPGKINFTLTGSAKLRRWICLFPVGLLLALTGCAHLFSWTSSPPKAEVKSGTAFTVDGSSGAVTMAQLQMKVMRFADDYVANVAQAADAFSAQATTPEGRLAGLRIKLGQATAAYTDASGENPVVNALDMLVLVTVTRMAVEDYGMETYGDAMRPVLETQRRLETNAWSLARGVLKPSQEQELKNMINTWRQKNPHQVYVGNLRFMEFASALGKAPKQSSASSSSIFSLLYIDPFAGLDPTAAAIEETRQLGERFMYYSQRMPALLAWQSEVVVLEMANQPESRQLLTNAQQLAASAESFSRTAGQLPKVINDQRQAAIQQVFDQMAGEGEKSRELLMEARQTLTAGSAAAESINAAIKSLDEFVRHVSPPATNTTVVDTNSPPFNVLDYGLAASQIGAAARDLNATLVTLNQSTPVLSNLSTTAAVNADKVVTRAFRLGLVLILVLLAGSVLAGLCYRILVKKIQDKSS